MRTLLLVLVLASPAAAQVTLPAASDRFAFTPSARHAADVASWGAVGGSLAWQVGQDIRADHTARALGRTACGLALAQGIVQGAKLAFRRDRPDHSDRKSFFSGHTASGTRWYFAVPIGILRMGAAKHDWADVAVGVADGVGSRYLCSRWIAK